MLATIKNYDLICYQLRNSLYSQPDNPLRKDIDQLSKEIADILDSNKKVQSQLTAPLLGQLFNLRVKAIQWLTADTNFDYLQMLNDVFPKIEKIGENEKLEVLAENILFALRCNQRVAESMFSLSNNQSDNFNIDFSQLPEITYEQFLASLAYAIPDNEAAQKIVDWTNASLRIEFVMLAADIMSDDKLKASDKTINELSFLVADAAQEYSALATEFGILKIHSNRQSFARLSFDNSFIKEQKKLADAGLDEFATNFTN